MLTVITPKPAVFNILRTIFSGSKFSREAQQRRILKDKNWRPVLIAIVGGKKIASEPLTATIPSEEPLVAITQLNEEETLNLCQVIHKNRQYRNVYVGLFGGRTFAETIPDAIENQPEINPEQ